MKFYTSVQQAGNNIHVRGYQNGIQFSHRVPFNPTLYLPTPQPSRWKTLEGDNVRPVKQGTIRDARKFVEDHKEIPDFEICGQTRYLNQYISEEYPEDEIKFDSSNIRVFTLDIETAAENGFPDIETADQEILLISLKDSQTGRIQVFGRYAFDNTHKDVDYMHFSTEDGMLKAFLHYWVSNFPDVITGWNVQLFDMTYISKRIERVLGERDAKMLSPWKSTLCREIYIKGRKQIAYDISGIATLDYLELYRKFTYTNQSSYRLDHIASVELDTKKLDHSEYDTFKEFYTKDWQKFVEYNIIDVRLVDQLDDKMKLLELAFTMAYDAKVNYEDIFSQVRMWDNYIYIELNKRKIAIPPKKEARKDAKYAGAYVKEPNPGFYDWIVSFDLNSLYPHLIMQYNLSPETLLPSRHPTATVDKLLEKEIDTSGIEECLAANGTLYSKSEQGFLPMMMQKMYDSRVVYKKRMIEAKKAYEKNPTVALKKEIARCNNIQMAKKISLNSAYGAIGNEHFRYFRLEIAEAITLSGQLSIRWISNKTNAYLNKILKTNNIDYVIACDTDSMYLNLGPLVETVFANREKTDASIVGFLDKVCEVEFEKFIESSYQELATYMNAYDQKMVMKRENIANRGFWTAKKRYVLNVWDSEGVRYKEPKMKICGMETARSSTPQYYRDKLYHAFEIILTKTNEDLIEFIEHVKSDTRKQDYVNIAFPRGCNGMTKYKSPYEIYMKGTPIHVRGSLLYNYHINKHKITNKYPIIQEGEKIKFIYLKTPNPLQENCISFFSDIPKEFNLDKYIDYQTQFEKSFLEPLKKVLGCISWDYEKKISPIIIFLIMSFLNSVIKDSKNEYASLVSDGVAAGDIESFVDTGSYIVNAVVSGSIFGGIPSNKITALAGESGTGKTFFCLSIVKHFLDTDPDAGVIYFETESAISKQMIESRDIDSNRMVIFPVDTIEEFRTQAVRIIDKFMEQPKETRKPLMFVLDSLGMLATNKEVQDATDDKQVRDMTKSQLIKSCFRILTLKMGKANIPMLVTNHTYDVIGSYVPTKEMGGGSGLKYSASTIIYLGKKKEKDGTTLIGNVIKCEAKKSRLTKEGSKVETRLFFDQRGLDKYYGMLELGERAGMWKNVAGRYEINGKKVYAKAILKEPGEYFTQEVLEKLDSQANKEFLYGVEDE